MQKILNIYDSIPDMLHLLYRAHALIKFPVIVNH